LAAAAREAAAHDEIVSFAELLHKAADLREVVAVVGIAHDYPPSSRSLDPAAQRIS
jgi:hypothetical protein